ncbi:MAG: DUF3592 domain-containing protein [Eubacteriales bacterium]
MKNEDYGDAVKIKKERQALLIGIVLLVAGFILIIWSTWFCWAARASVYWPITQGKVLSVKDNVNRGGDAVYEYWVNNKRYVSDRVAFVPMNIPARISESFPVESPIQVRYNPWNPATAVLVPGITTAQYLVIFAALVPAFFGFVLTYGFVVGRRKKKVKDLLSDKPYTLWARVMNGVMVVHGGVFRTWLLLVSFFQSLVIAGVMEAFADLLAGRIIYFPGVVTFVVLFVLPLVYGFWAHPRIDIIISGAELCIVRRRRSDPSTDGCRMTYLRSDILSVSCDKQGAELTLCFVDEIRLSISNKDGFVPAELKWLARVIESSKARELCHRENEVGR